MRNKWHHKFQEMDILTCSLQVACEDKKDDIRLYKHMPQCNRKGEMVLGTLLSFWVEEKIIGDSIRDLLIP